MRHTYGWSIAILILAACAPQVRVPMLSRPDTRHMLSAEMDSSVLRQIAETFADSLPNEAGVCLTLAVRDTTLGSVPHALYMATVVRSDPAATARATPFNVWFDQRQYRNGCESSRQFAMAHSHPYSAEPFSCTHSDQDAMFLASDPRLLFTLVLCGDGRGEVMWQDGRRHALQWLRPDRSEMP